MCRRRTRRPLGTVTVALARVTRRSGFLPVWYMAVAVAIGSIELVSMLGSELGVHGGLIGALGSIDINTAGFVVVGLFVVTWVVALAVWRFAGVEERFSSSS